MDNKQTATNPSQTCTALACVESTEKKNENVLSIDKPIKMLPPIVLLFAEYYGYISPFLDWATEMASGKEIDPIKKKLIYLDAKIISDKLKKEDTIEKIRETYIMLHEIVFAKYESILEGLFDYDDLPF